MSTIYLSRRDPGQQGGTYDHGRHSHGIVTAAEVGTLAPGRVVEMTRAADHPDAEAVLIPDTAMHTLSILDDLEQAVGKPVLTANQVTVWKGLDLAGAGRRIDGLGTLFAEPVTAGDRS